MGRGLFIAIEGPDGCGKSTQIERLAAHLSERGREVLLTREPGGTKVGEEIRRLLLLPREEELSPVCELLLFEAARAQHVREVLRPALAAGKVVVASRYSDATVAYQKGGRGLPLETVEAANALGEEGLRTDLTIIIDIDCEEGLRRAGRTAGKDLPGSGLDRIESAGLAFHRRVREAYLELAKREPGRCLVIDGRGTREEVAAAIAAAVDARLEAE